ncbi:MAG: TonB-dependent receptor [Thermoanaerobaculia bacterium]|nr:MAG: TonB-dependent receptor [Thermoanaerobaculia bacterium]
MTKWMKVTALVAVALLVASGAIAQTSGRVVGTVKDANGAALPGVALTATGPTLPGNVSAVSGSDGSFRLLSLPPGTYTVTATLDGFNTVEQRDIAVGIDRTVTLELTMTAAFAGELTVLGEAPVVDTTRATSGISVSADTFEKLPLARDFYAIAQVATGAGADASGTTFYGSTGAENQYVIEGLNTTGVEVGDVGKTLNFDFIQEVEVKTGGLPAEYGRLTGGLINAITKSGGNEFSGDVFGYYEGGSLQSDDSTAADRPATTTQVVNTDKRTDYGFDLGGYFVKDKLWFFGAYTRVDRTDETEIIRALSAPGSPGIGSKIGQDRVSDLYSGKLTWRINSSNNLSATVFGDPQTREGNVFTISGPQSTWDGKRDIGSDDYVARYDGVFGGSWVIEGLYGLHQEEDKTTGPGKTIPNYLDFRVVPTAVTGGFGFHQDQEFEREALKLDVSKFLGNVELKFGGDEETTSAVNSNFNGGAGQRIYIFTDPATGRTYYRHRYYIDDRVAGFDRSNPATWQLAVPLTSEPESVSTAAYAQASWKVTPSFTLNLGYRWEQQEVKGRDGSTAFKLDDNYSPRVAFIWDPSANGRSKLYGSWGRYYENIPMDINIRAFGGEISCFCYNFSPDPANYLADPNAPRRSGLLGGSTEPVDPDLKGQYIDEMQLGFEYEVAPNFSLGITGTRRELGRVIEDFLVISEGNYFIANPGEGQFGQFMTFYDYSEVPAPKAEREYTGIELNAKKRYSNGWLMYASYLWSKLEGNYDGVFQASTGQLDPNINSAFDYADFTINAQGKLSNDRTHTFKVHGGYTFQDGPVEGLNIGASAYWRSGTPLNAYGYSFAYSNWEYYLAPRGSLGRGPSDYEANLNISYPVKIGDYELQFMVDVFNLLDRQAITTYDERYNLASDGPCAGVPDAICNGDGGLLHDGASINPVGQLGNPRATATNPDYLSAGTNFSGQRNIRVGVRFRF